MDEKSSAVSVLTVSPFESDLILLSNLISHSAWSHRCARSVQDACAILNSEEIHVVLCDVELPDGDWRTVLEFATEIAVPPELVVLSRVPDERLWATVLNVGAWDVLTKPINPKEFYRTVHHAFRNWAENAKRRPKSVVSGFGRQGAVVEPHRKLAVAGR